MIPSQVMGKQARRSSAVQGHSRADERQIKRGFPQPFRPGDLVRFSTGAEYGFVDEYRITKVFRDGFEVIVEDQPEVFEDADVLDLGMVHAHENTEGPGV